MDLKALGRVVPSGWIEQAVAALDDGQFMRLVVELVNIRHRLTGRPASEIAEDLSNEMQKLRK